MQFKTKAIINASPESIYNTWLNSEGHSKMTGGAAVITDKLNDYFTAWDGYIQGKNIELEANKRILQSWRTTQFEPHEEDSLIEILFKEIEGKTELTLIHSNLSENGEHYKEGWSEHYFKPMKKYFNK